MFTGVSLDKALKHWKNGKEVIVLDRTVKSPAGGYETYSLDELFKNLELLADVPAVENPEFKQAVADMVQSGQKQEESSEEKNSTPPLPPTGPEVSEMLPAGKTKKEIALQLAEQGMKAPEIAKKIDAKYSTVYNWLNPDKCRPKKKAEEISVNYKNPDARPGWNADRKKCKTCKFRPASALKSNGAGCDYCDLVGHSRGCAVEDCDRYEKGNRIERKLVMHDSVYKSKI